ncbi:MAG: adenosine deaminase [Clostridiales bacterium]|jgi:adenosine deaminase|nr:adenosine deaminase [Clostridiales bacterium]
MIDLKKIPKIELHVHLDGSLNIDKISEITKEDKKVLEEKMTAGEKLSSLKDYLDKFDYAVSLLQIPDLIRKLASSLREDLIKDNVIYAEVRYAPLKHISYISMDEFIDIVYEELNKDKKLKVKLILCMMRNDSKLNNMKVINLAKKHLKKEVVGIDLAGDEDSYPTKDFKDLFDYANELKIPITIHSGESTNYKEVEAALNMHAKRIGHGIRSIDNFDLINKLKDNNILLELCPTSNVQTNSVDIYKNHPIKLFSLLGVTYSINTDNRLVSEIDLSREYKKLIDNRLVTIEGIIKSNLNAIKYSFLTEEEKVTLFKKYNDLLREM